MKILVVNCNLHNTILNMKKLVFTLAFILNAVAYLKAQTAPVANFSIFRDTICIGVTDTFYDLHTGGPIVAYSMLFGDAYYSAGLTTPPTQFAHSYSVAQTYNVEYILSTVYPITRAPGTYDSIIKTVVVINSLDASFTTSNNPGCYNGYDTLKLTNPISGVTYTPGYSTASPVGTATPNTGYPLKLPSTGLNITFSMTASGAFGCPNATANFTSSLQGCSAPHAAFAMDSAGVSPHHYCQGTTYYATDQSYGGSGNIISWQWDFNATNLFPPPTPATATGVGPHPIMYLGSGIYYAKLTVTDINGFKDSTTNYTVTVLGSCGNAVFAPFFNAYPSPNNPNIQMCQGDSDQFTDNSVPIGAAIGWHWHWGDGTPDAYVPTVWHGWSAGSWNMWYAAQDPNTLNWDTTYATVTVGAAPPAAAGRDTLVCKGQSVQIGTTAQLNSVYSWTSLPAGYTNATANPTVSPNDTTTYFLVASNLAGTCFNYDTVKINVDVPPTVYLTASSLGECINNDDTIYAAPSNLTFGSINLPNGGSSINSVPPNGWVVSWAQSGSQTVTVTAKTQHGCVAAVNSVTINIHSCQPPIALFYPPTSICTGLPIKFTDSSKGSPTNWLWNFGSGAFPSTDTARNPIVTFNSPGKHYITLTVSNSGGTSIYSDSITAYVAATSTFSFIPQVCAGYNKINKRLRCI